MHLKMEISEEQLLDLLRKKFGFQQFREGQYQAIHRLMTTGNLLCIQPTGFGKSLLYQLPSMLLTGMTLVISPLLALMRDQQEHLNHRFQIPAAAINSDQSDEENAAAYAKATSGSLKVLFIAPEQLEHVDRFNFLLNLPISLVVVDEAHCISMWGHDFRPSYRQIIQCVRGLYQKNPDIKILSLTATANSATEKDIVEQLAMDGKPLTVIREGMDRPNIHLSVIKTSSAEEKLLLCKHLVEKLEKCGLIYCATRENAELVSDYLNLQGINAQAYHAGLDPEDKRRLQKEFINDKYTVLAATNALGMGIDKPNLRYIIHYDIPGSISSYYQEVGRCGRDGLKADGILLYHPQDLKIQHHFIESAQPTTDDFSNILKAVSTAPQAPNLSAIKSITGLHPTRVTVVIAELLEQEFLRKFAESGIQRYKITNKMGDPILTRYTMQYAVKKKELDLITLYAQQAENCRMAMLREALGETNPKKCGRCCVCIENQLPVQTNTQDTSPVSTWLSKRTVEINAAKLVGMSAGIAILDGKLKSPLFANFMRNRKDSSTGDIANQEELWNLLKQSLDKLVEKQKITGVVAIPSQTWAARDTWAKRIADYLKVPVYLNMLIWTSAPSSRQGELLNNDQRKENVHQKMTAQKEAAFPRGPILLVDDYTGSGATLKEGTRALRKAAGIRNDVIPLTIAAVKWRLGASGMI